MTGVIEGFYGQPWTQAQRFELFDWMVRWRLNTYLYAPKDDLKHRAVWREVYPESEAKNIRDLIHACTERNISFVYALSPGLDIRYADETDLACLKKRFEQMLALGCRCFALLFDDIPDRMHAEDAERFGSFASAQCHVTNTIVRWIRKRDRGVRFLFCPTAYCGRMAAARLGGKNYLLTLGRELDQAIDVFWTGPEIISTQITATHIRRLRSVLRRKPLIWDNLHANDYDGRRFFCGPYSGRSTDLRSVVSGFLTNPNNEFPLNYVPLRTFGEFVRCQGTWDARKAYLSALREWLPYFETVGTPVAFEDLILLGDCYYLPHKEGPEAEALYTCAKSLLAGNIAKRGTEVASFRKQATRLREFCVRLTELRNRPLFYALSRRLWELREELDLLERYVDFQLANGDPNTPFRSDSHLPGTCRGGIVPRLQRLLSQQSDGAFTPVRISQPGAAKKRRAFSSP